MERDYKQAQIAKGRPPEPREALKRTYGNNWVHITCAVWTPETKFGNAKSLDQVECIPQIPPARWGQTCKLCKRSSGGACVTCHQCHATFHIGCAHDAAYTFGFDITPVKGSRRDGANIVTFGNETGVATAAIWCKEHNPKTIVHLSNEVVDDQGTFALQRYVLNFKQADLTLTGTTRKANLLDESAKNIVTNGAVQAPNRRASTTTGAATSSRAGRNSNAGTSGAIEREVEHGPPSSAPSDRKCDKCEVDVSPRWFPVKERDKAHAAEAVRHPPTTDGLPTVNGIKHEPPNFNALHQPDTRMVNGVDDASHQERFLCQKCHWRRKNGQEEPPKPDSHEPDHSSGARSPTRPPLFPPLPEVSNALPRALHQWFPHVPPPATVAREPQLPGPVVGMYHNSTLPPQHQPSHAGPGFLMANPAGVPPANRSPFQPRHSTHGPPAPLNLQQSALVSGMPNGLPSPNLHMHGHGPPMGSPTHPLTGSAHQNGSPFSGPSQHLPSLVGSHGSHGSPPPASLGGRPSTPRDTPQQAVVPPGSDGRPVGGASASPSLRNLLH